MIADDVGDSRPAHQLDPAADEGLHVPAIEPRGPPGGVVDASATNWYHIGLCDNTNLVHDFKRKIRPDTNRQKLLV
jgi:hypothetical protein